VIKPDKSSGASEAATPTAPTIEIPQSLSVRQLADLLKVSSVDTIKQLMRNGIMANINQVVSYEAAATVATDFGYEVRQKPQAGWEVAAAISEVKRHQQQEEGARNLQSRPPVVTIMGHVDHGKTRLLDAIRQTNVMDTEAGGITQHIGAYQVDVDGGKVTFLDTPGHEAFTAMRARGAQVTDVAVLVVAADEGLKPQTLEAIDHAKAANVPIVVAINKIDKTGANPEMVKQQLADVGLLVEEWGGDVVCVPVSAKEKTGIADLLSNILVVAEVADLKANPSRLAEAVVIEAEMDRTKGPLATVLVHNGTVKVGDVVVVGATWGKVKAMFNDAGKRVRKAGPSTPVEILGLSSVPQVGDILTAVPDDRQARALIQKRQQEMELKAAAQQMSLGNLFDKISSGQVKELNIILKADVQGSIEPIRASLERLGAEGVQVRVIHGGTGNVAESDVMLAIASKGLIIGFGTGVEPGAQRLADVEGINIRIYSIIYELLDDVGKALKGMLEPKYTEVIDGRAEVRAVFPAGKKNKVAGVYVTEGKAVRSSSVRVRRQGQVMIESAVDSLRRFKNDAKEVATGYECGVGIEKFNDFQPGDILEFFHIEKTI